MSEFKIIEKYIAPLTSSKESFDLKNDGAILKTLPPNLEYVISKDAIVEGVHFLDNSNPKNLAKKIVRVNISDLSAMGAKPIYYLMAAILPSKINEEWVKAFTESLLEENTKFGISIIGGDTVVAGDKLIISMTIIGSAQKNMALRRDTAKINDDIYISGPIGDSVIGLKILQSKIICNSTKDRDFLVNKYHVPELQIDFGCKIVGLANAAIDISDGFIQDLEHICKNSNVGAKIFLDKIPLSNSTKRIISLNNDLLETILSGGDDYQIIFTAPKNKRNKIKKIMNINNYKYYHIGDITDDKSIRVIDINNQEIKISKKGYDHFDLNN